MTAIKVNTAAGLVAAFVAGMIIASGGMVAAQGSGPAAAPASKTPQEPSDAAKARLQAVERVCGILHDRETGAPTGHEGVEHTYLWSKRRMEAQREVELERDGGVAAAQSHLERMQAWRDRVAAAHEKGAFSTFDMAATEFYVAEAADLLAQARSATGK